MGDAGGFQKGAGRMSRKYIRYDKPEVYGIIYKSERIIYHNIGFVGQTKLFILCPYLKSGRKMPDYIKHMERDAKGRMIP